MDGVALRNFLEGHGRVHLEVLDAGGQFGGAHGFLDFGVGQGLGLDGRAVAAGSEDRELWSSA